MSEPNPQHPAAPASQSPFAPPSAVAPAAPAPPLPEASSWQLATDGTDAAATSRPAAPPARRRRLGAIALTAALVALLGGAVAGATALYAIGLGAGPGIENAGTTIERSGLAFLTPVRGWVLMAEITFWVATALGITALVLGIVATARNRGRGTGIAAIGIAAIAPGLVWFTAILARTLGVGMSTGPS